jgi:catechol 2,3-dioxygenase-like lactoylglutathione lyase family enzyme
MKRIHIHISVDDLDRSIVFYNTLFGTAPTVEKPDYAKWMLDDPLVNFAISQRGAKAGLDHVGIQVDTNEALLEIKTRLDEAELRTLTQEGTTCCYAKSDKHWIVDPSGIAWETYHTLDSAPTFNEPAVAQSTENACCAPTPQTIQMISRKR